MPVRGRVLEVARGGDAVVETDAGKVFVPGGLAGEIVEVDEPRRKQGALRAKLLHVVDASPHRVQPACKYVHECGGCSLMHASMDAQLDIKRSFVRHAVGPTAPIHVHRGGDAVGYRRRARLHFRAGERGGTLGYQPRGSRDVIDIETCLVLRPGLGEALCAFREKLLPVLKGEGEVWLAYGANNRAVVWLETRTEQSSEAYRAIERFAGDANVAGAALQCGDTAPALWGSPEEVSLGADGVPLVGPVFGFSQANAETNHELVNVAVALAQPEGLAVLELFSGNGNFTVALARSAKSVRAMESHEASVKACQRNVVARGFENVTAVLTDLGENRTGWPKRTDIVLLDPPRAGARECMAPIAALGPKRVVYVSCDTATLERDAKGLLEAGYEIREAHLFDMFPQTAHVETVALFVKTARS